jgi:hypothetical protein
MANAFLANLGHLIRDVARPGRSQTRVKKFFSEQINIGDLPPPRRPKIFGQCTILGVKKIFPD